MKYKSNVIRRNIKYIVNYNVLLREYFLKEYYKFTLYWN